MEYRYDFVVNEGADTCAKYLAAVWDELKNLREKCFTSIGKDKLAM